MKILHTGDWHLGKIVNQVYMTNDQEFILNQLCKIIDLEKPDVVIISGDIFDRAVPPVEAVELLNKVFNEILLIKKVPVIAIAGNHDSGDRVAFGSRLLEKNGLYIEGKISNNIRKIVLQDCYGPVNFYLLPYADPMEIKKVFNEEEIHDYNDGFKIMLNKIDEGINKKERNILIAHGYIRGAGDLIESESERPLSIGGTEYVDAAIFSNFEYTALGHLHGAQKVLGNSIRYGGSILKYSFSEVRHNKSVTIVNLKEKEKEPEITLINLIPLRDMRIIKGELQELINVAKSETEGKEDYIKAILTDQGELIDPMSKLRAVYPNVLELVRESVTNNVIAGKTSPKGDYRNKSTLELFREFYESISGIELSKEKEEILKSILKEAEKEERLVQ